MGRLVVGYWDCKYCGTKGVLGTEQTCPNCGRQRDKDTRFYMDRNRVQTVDEVVSDSAQANKLKRRGADWVCAYCDSLNSSDATNCAACGSSRETAAGDYHSQRRKDAATNQQHNTDDAATHMSNAEYADTSTNDYDTYACTAPRRFNWKRGLTIAGIIAGVAALITLIVFLALPKQARIQIDGIQWQYSIDVEEYRTLHEADWSVPPGGRITGTESRIYRYDSVLDHYDEHWEEYEDIVGYEEVVVGYDYEDKGNGLFEEVPQTEQRPIYETKRRLVSEPVYVDVPVYATWYDYDIERWVFDYSVPSSGTTHDTYWGDVSNLDEYHRSSSTHKKYTVTGSKLSKDGQVEQAGSKTYTVSENDWLQIEVGDVVDCKIAIDGTLTLIQTGVSTSEV